MTVLISVTKSNLPPIKQEASKTHSVPLIEKFHISPSSLTMKCFFFCREKKCVSCRENKFVCHAKEEVHKYIYKYKLFYMEVVMEEQKTGLTPILRKWKHLWVVLLLWAFMILQLFLIFGAHIQFLGLMQFQMLCQANSSESYHRKFSAIITKYRHHAIILILKNYKVETSGRKTFKKL